MKKLLLLSFCLFCLGCESPPEEMDVIRYVKSYKVVDPRRLRSRPFPGVTRAENRVNLSFRVDGPLVKFPVDVGDKVKASDILARIDPRDYEVALINAQANLDKSEAALSFAESDYARAERIQKGDPGAISESLVDRKREERNRLRADVRSYDSQVEAAKDKLAYTLLKAPFDGIVVAKYVENYEFVKARQPILRMLDNSRIEMVVDVPEHIITYIPNVKSVVVNLDIFQGRRFSASIKEIGTEPSTTSRTYPVTLLIKQPSDVQILPGMSGEAKFIGKMTGSGAPITVTVPVAAVFSDDGSDNSYVWVINSETERVHRQIIKLGRLTPTGITVEEGLQPGEWVVSAGVHHLREDQKVRILDESEQ